MNKDSKRYYNYGVQKFKIGNGSDPAGFYQSFVQDEKDMGKIEDLFQRRQINEITIKTSAAVSKLKRVRVLGSKKRVATTLPVSKSLFGFSSKSSALSRIRVISSTLS